MHKPIRCLITAGPTREFIDPVRFISNPSSGKMGYALAEAALKRGWEVDLVSGPVSISAPKGVECCSVVSGQEMYEACEQRFPQCDILIMCAAVMDMRPKKIFKEKQKKDSIEWSVEFEPVIDILKTLSIQKSQQLLVGFAAETTNIEAYAQKKLREKNLDWIVANNVSTPGAGFESDNNKVILYSNTGKVEPFGPKSKLDIATDILNCIVP